MKYSVFVLTLVFLIYLCASASAAEYTDSLGRVVDVPDTIDSVSPSGSLAQIVLYTFDPSSFVSLHSGFTSGEKMFINESLWNLPVTGSLFGSKSTMNPEEIMAMNQRIGIDVILDVGELKESNIPVLNNMQEKTGIPFVYITQKEIYDIPESYRALGKLLGKEERGNELADYSQKIIDELDDGMKTVEKKVSVIYVATVDSNAVYLLGRSSYHAEILEKFAENIAPAAKSGSGLGDTYTMEDIMQMNPDYIIVAEKSYGDHSYYDQIMSSPLWQTLPAVQNGNVYEGPAECPFDWFGMPPAPNRLLSVIWFGNLFYPEVFDYNLYDRISDFYRVFYSIDLTEEQFSDIAVYAQRGHALSSQPSQSPVSDTSNSEKSGLPAVIGLIAVISAAAVIRRN